MRVVGINQELLQTLQLQIEIIETERDFAVVLVGHDQAITFRDVDLANLKSRLHETARAQAQQLERGPGFRRFDGLAGLERFARATQNQRQSQIFRQQLLLFHQNAARVHQKSGVGSKWVGDLFLARDPADWFAFNNSNVDFGRKFSGNFNFIDLWQFLQPLVHAPQVHPENIFAFTQLRHAQNLLALQRSVGLDLDTGQFVIRIIDKEAFGRDPTADVNCANQRSHERNL